VATDPLGREAHFSYDQLAALAAKTAPDGGITIHTGTTPWGGTVHRDPLGAVKEMTYATGPGRSTSTGWSPARAGPRTTTLCNRYEGIDGPRGGPWSSSSPVLI